MELAELKKALADRAEEVCRELLPNGKAERGEWKCGDLTGAAGGSLGVVLNGDKAGVWRDFAAGVGGSNLLELWVQARNLPFQDALKSAREWLMARGVNAAQDLRTLRKKAYQKPSIAGITYIEDRGVFYLTTERQLTKEVIDLYRIASLEGDDVIVFPYLSETDPHPAEMVKYVKRERDERGKKVSWTSKDTAKVLFGKHTRKATDRYLLICEGEIDAMTWHMAGVENLCCTSVPFGAKFEGKDGRDPNSEWIENDWDFIHSFERIYLSMDMDEEGRMAQSSLVKRLGREVCYCVELPTKDANELLQAGREGELVNAYLAAKTLDPAALKNASEFRADVLDRLYSGDDAVKRGIPLPFGAHPFHIRWNEWTTITGINGSGKSTVLNFILLYFAKLGYKSCIASLEVQVKQTLAFHVQQATGEKLPPREKGEAALDWIAQCFWFYDHVGRANLDDLLAAFRYAHRRYGVRFFVIDSWMKLGIKQEDLDAQADAIGKLSGFIDEFDVHVFVVTHPRKLKHEGEKVGKLDIKGSGQITDEAHNVLVMRRNKAKEKDLERSIKLKDDDAIVASKRRAKPDAELAVEKQRNDDGDEPTIDLWYVKSSKQYFGHYRDTGVSLVSSEIPPAPTEAPAQAQVSGDESF